MPLIVMISDYFHGQILTLGNYVQLKNVKRVRDQSISNLSSLFQNNFPKYPTLDTKLSVISDKESYT